MTMMEKRGTILLTEKEYQEYLSGSIPQRLVDEWSMTITELTFYISNGNYEIIKDNN